MATPFTLVKTTHVNVGRLPSAVSSGSHEAGGAMTIAGPLGVALGSVIRNQVAAIVVVFAWLLVLEPLLGAGLEDNAKYLPGAAIAAILRTVTVLVPEP